MNIKSIAIGISLFWLTSGAIIFNCCEGKYSPPFIIFSGAVVSTLAAIYIANSNTILASQKEQERLGVLKNYVLTMLEKTISEIQEQITNLETFILELSKTSSQTQNLALINFWSIKSLSKTSDVDLYKVFIENTPETLDDKIEHYKSIKESIYVIQYLNSLTQTNFHSFYEKSTARAEKFRENITSINFIYEKMRHLVAYNTKYQSNLNSEFMTQFVKLMNNILLKNVKSGDFDKENLYDYNSKLLPPVSELCIKSTDDLDYPPQILKLANEAHHQFQNYEYLKSDCQDVFESMKKDYENILGKIQLSLEYFEKKEK